MNPIQTNRPVFFGNNGEVLKSGMIYIGQPDQWPISFPKTVTLQDSAGTQFTAVQPLRTNNQGRIEYNGKAVIALVDGNYSMLVRDRNGVTVADGYTPLIENATGSGSSATEGVTQVGLLLTDIKAFEVTAGETVRNVGKSTALDGLGADWLVVSDTGSPADDIDLIDFANGTQGKRVNSKRYTKDTIAVSEGGTGSTTASGARANLGGLALVDTLAPIALNGDFSGGQIQISKVGDTVTLTAVASITHVSTASPGSTAIIPSGYRPASSIDSVWDMDATTVSRVKLSQSGEVFVTYRDWAGGTVARTSPLVAGDVFSITYNV